MGVERRMGGKDLIFPKVGYFFVCLSLMLTTNLVHADTSTSDGALAGNSLRAVLQRVNCIEGELSCTNVLPPLPRLGNASALDGLERAYWAQRYFEEGKLHRAYLALLQVPKSWWKLSKFREMEKALLGQLGLVSGTSGLRLFDGPLLKHVDRWIGSALEQITRSDSWQVAESAWFHRHQSIENLISRVRADLNAKSLEKSVRMALADRQPKVALERLSTIESQVNKPCWWWYLKTKALRNLRRWSDAQEVLVKGVSQCRPHEPSHPWLLLLGTRIQTVRGNRSAAFTLARTLKELYPHHRLYDDAVYRLIRLHLSDANGLENALKLAQEQVAVSTVGDRVDDAIFQVALALINRKQWTDAAALLEAACRKAHWQESDGEEGRCWYWLARVRSMSGDDVRSAYVNLFHAYPYSWYGLIAAQRAKLDLLSVRDIHAAYQASKRDELSWVLSELDAWQAQGNTVHAQAFIDQSKALARHLISFEYVPIECPNLGANACLHLAESIQPISTLSPPMKGNRKRLAPYFPKAYRRMVRLQSKRQNVPKTMIWAIMREESRYDRAAVSFVGAKGLMQLMPQTASDMARSEGLRQPQLFYPPTNIRLGTRYLRFVQTYVKTSWVVVPPGYNAGQGALRRWLNRAADEELDLFVENLPYDEARSYTKRVNRSFAIYQLLLNQTPYSLIGQVGELTNPR